MLEDCKIEPLKIPAIWYYESVHCYHLSDQERKGRNVTHLQGAK